MLFEHFFVNCKIEMTSLKQFILCSNLFSKLEKSCFKEAIFIWELAKKCSKSNFLERKYIFFHKLIPNLLGHPVMQIRGKYFLGNWKNTSLSFLLPRSINGMCGRLELWNLTTFAENAICRGDFKWWCQLRIWLRKK